MIIAETLMKIFNKTKKFIRMLKKADHKDVFSKIYHNQTWGESQSSNPYYSGGGSNDEYAMPYIAAISQFIKQHQIKKVVDLGCGDFRIGKQLTLMNDIDYHGIDIVPEMIKYNIQKFASKKISFSLLNIVKNKIPDGELYLIRQVLQHLSNTDIKKILSKLNKEKHVIITEHQPISGNITFNLDKTSGANIRLEKNSGVFLEYPPFNKKLKKLLVVPVEDGDSIIATYYVTL